MDGIRGQDVVVLLKLASIQEHLAQLGDEAEVWAGQQDKPLFSVRGLEAQLGISKTEVNASIKRSLATGLAIRDRGNDWPRPHSRNLYSFIIHGLKFIFPAVPGAMVRGFPTAFAAPTLEGLLVSGGQYIYVWPAADGHSMGQGVKPLFKSVPFAARKDPRLYEYLALIDAIRLGSPREVGLAQDRLAEGLLRHDH